MRVWQTTKQMGTANLYASARWATTPQAQAVVKLLGYDDPGNTSLARKRDAAMEILGTQTRDCNDQISRDDLINRFQKLGTWSLVAKYYGISSGTMTYHVQRAGISERDVQKYRKNRSRWDKR